MSSSISSAFYIGSNIVFVPEKHNLVIDGSNCHLEPLQSKLLLLLIRNRGKVLSTQDIADQIWQRSHVSSSLVRQVISQLRAHLQDQKRPYTVIKTIPKQGYLFDIDVTEKDQKTLPDENSKDEMLSRFDTPAVAKKKRNFRLGVSVVIIGFLGWIFWWQSNTIIIEQSSTETVPVVFYDIVLDKNTDYNIAKNTYNYIFYGLNSSKFISGYHFKQLRADSKKQLTNDSIELKSWIKETDNGYTINISLVNNRDPKLSTKIDKEFNTSNFFDNIGDLILELKTNITPVVAKYNVNNHRLTTVKDYEDWDAISEGISLFYQGNGQREFADIKIRLEEIINESRDNYLVYSLLSYISSVDYLKDGNDTEKKKALDFAYKAFDKNPRCDMANISLGLALILNNDTEKAFPYLYYAAESAPSPLSYYLLNIVEQKSHNERGAAYSYQSFIELNKQKSGQLFELMTSSQQIDTSK